MEMNWRRAIQTNARPQPTTLPWKHQYPTSFLLRCAYKRLSSPSESLSSAEIGTEEAAYLLFILLLHLQLNSALSWTDGHARLLQRKINRLKPPWTTGVCRLHSYILISLPLPSCMQRGADHPCTLAQDWHRNTGSETPWCGRDAPLVLNAKAEGR